jgi:hypothetical protein
VDGPQKPAPGSGVVAARLPPDIRVTRGDRVADGHAAMNLDAILAPLPGDSSCGDDLSFDPAFDDILELRGEDDPTIAQGAWVRELPRADWPGVVAMGTTLLTTRTKDLRLAGWWLDAAARVSGQRQCGVAPCCSIVARAIRARGRYRARCRDRCRA